MTTLIAIQHDDWCIIAGDSQTTSYHLSGDCSPMGKIATNGKYLVAAAGLVRGMNLIQHSFAPPRAPKNNLDKFMVTKFLPALRSAFMKSCSFFRVELPESMSATARSRRAAWKVIVALSVVETHPIYTKYPQQHEIYHSSRYCLKK
jgi:hypothetical protein